MISASKQKHIANVFAPDRVTRLCHIASNSRTLSLHSNFNLIVNFWEDMESAKESLNIDNVENMLQMCLRETYCIHGLEESILSKWLSYPKQSIDSMQSLSSYQWYFLQN